MTLNPNVQAAIVTACAMLVTFVFSQIVNFVSNRSQRKHEARIKFFYEMYPKRLAVYDEVNDTLVEICQYASKLTKMERFKANEVIIADTYRLKKLCHKLSVYGSLETWEIMGALFVKLRELSLEYMELDVESDEICEVESGKVKIPDKVALGAFALAAVSAVNTGYRAFTDAVRAETGENLIDKEITDFLKKTVIPSNKSKRNNPVA